MVKRRTPQAATKEPTEEQIEFFASGADAPLQKTQREKSLDPNAKRDFKGISVGFNEHEFKELTEGCAITGRSKLNFIRQAILKAVEKAKNQH